MYVTCTHRSDCESILHLLQKGHGLTTQQESSDQKVSLTIHSKLRESHARRLLHFREETSLIPGRTIRRRSFVRSSCFARLCDCRFSCGGGGGGEGGRGDGRRDVQRKPWARDSQTRSLATRGGRRGASSEISPFARCHFSLKIL